LLLSLTEKVGAEQIFNKKRPLGRFLFF